MAFPQLSASMLLASLILLYWTTSSARSHDPMSSVVSPPYRVKRDQPFERREKVRESLEMANNLLTFTNDNFEKIEKVVQSGFEAIGKTDPRKVSNIMKGLANIVSFASGIGGLVASIVNMVLIFIPQDDPVLNEVKKGFAEVNRKLDSISIQISNLATDVEWFNYASVYSQDELRILNAWNKFNYLIQKSQLVQNEEQKLRLAEMFVNYYENTGTEASVANLYHYLVVKDTSLSGNLNELLRRKFKCDFLEISKYNIYFSSLMWKGMVLNQFYWKLIGLDPSGIEAKHHQMFNYVYKAQKSALEYCLTNHMKYVKEDVVEIRKGLSTDNKKAIADRVKEFLDKKYAWYNWVVLVYDTKQADYYILYELTKIIEDPITIAVGYTLVASVEDENEVRKAADNCFIDKQCDIKNKLHNCGYSLRPNPHSYYKYKFTEYAKATHAAYGKEFAVAPEPFLQKDCGLARSTKKISIYYSHRLPVCQQCNNGMCQQLLDSNEWMCECFDGYYGDRCEKKTPTHTAVVVDVPVVPDVSTIDAKMKKMEAQLKFILLTLKYKCRGKFEISADR